MAVCRRAGHRARPPRHGRCRHRLPARKVRVDGSGAPSSMLTPRSWRARRISAWERSRPTTRTARAAGSPPLRRRRGPSWRGRRSGRGDRRNRRRWWGSAAVGAGDTVTSRMNSGLMLPFDRSTRPHADGVISGRGGIVTSKPAVQRCAGERLLHVGTGSVGVAVVHDLQSTKTRTPPAASRALAMVQPLMWTPPPHVLHQVDRRRTGRRR